MPPLHRPGLLVAICLFIQLTDLSLPIAVAQRNRNSAPRFQEGDEVEYQWGSKWYPGVVLQVEGNRVGIEYEWGSSLKREVVDAIKLRFAWEAQALTPMRFWSDQSKQFKIRAAAIGLDAETVTLQKQEGGQISVPIAKLSDTDQSYLKRLQKQAGPPVPQLPPASDFQRLSSSGYSWNKATNLSDVPPDPAPSFATLPMKGVAFPRAHFHEDLIRVDPIGGGDGWMVAGTVDPLENHPSRVLWAALSAGEVKRVQFLPPGQRLIAVDPPSRQLLTVHDEGPTLTLWTADPSMESAEPVKSWVSVADSKWGSSQNWGAIVAPNRILHQWGKHQFVVWDAVAEKEVFHIEQESFFSARPNLSPGKKYIALPEDKRVRIIEAATGNTLASLEIEGGSAAGVGFSPDGQRLAVLTRSQLAVWELGSAAEPARYRADAIGTPFTAIVEWVDQHSLLIDRETLYNTELQLPVWSYSTKTFEVESDSATARTTSVLAGKLCYAVNIEGRKGFVVGAVDLPGPGVTEAVSSLDPESLYIIRAGHAVALDIKCGPYNQEVQQALMKQIQDNGWVYDSNADTVLHATMGRGEPQTVTYKMTSARGGGESSQTVSVTPYFSRLRLVYRGTNAWQTAGGSGLPPVMFVREGESMQAKASEMQKPDPDLFRRIDIPDKIFDPTKKNGLGSSLISAQGLTPQ